MDGEAPIKRLTNSTNKSTKCPMNSLKVVMFMRDDDEDNEDGKDAADDDFLSQVSRMGKRMELKQ